MFGLQNKSWFIAFIMEKQVLFPDTASTSRTSWMWDDVGEERVNLIFSACSSSSTRSCRRCTLWVTVCPWLLSLRGAPSSVCSGNNLHLPSSWSHTSYLLWFEWNLLQEATLHQELHPPQPLSVLHPASRGRAGQRWHPLQSNVAVL